MCACMRSCVRMHVSTSAVNMRSFAYVSTYVYDCMHVCECLCTCVRARAIVSVHVSVPVLVCLRNCVRTNVCHERYTVLQPYFNNHPNMWLFLSFTLGECTIDSTRRTRGCRSTTGQYSWHLKYRKDEVHDMASLFVVTSSHYLFFFRVFFI